MPPSRVQGTAGEAGAATLGLTLNSIVSGHVILVSFCGLGAASGSSSVTNTGGGTYHQVDTIFTGGNGVEHGYITGASGNTTVTMGFSGGAATTGCIEEMTAGTLDKHNFSAGNTVAANGTLATAVTTTAVDYCWSWAVDAVGNGGTAQTVGAPYTQRDTNVTFPIADGDATQGSSGLITATWTFNVATTGAAVGVMAFSTSSSFVPDEDYFKPNSPWPVDPTTTVFS